MNNFSNGQFLFHESATFTKTPFEIQNSFVHSKITTLGSRHNCFVKFFSPLPFGKRRSNFGQVGFKDNCGILPQYIHMPNVF